MANDAVIRLSPIGVESATIFWEAEPAEGHLGSNGGESGT
jgi:hypothetical protein